MKNYSYDGNTINLSPSGTSYTSGQVVAVGNDWYAITVTAIKDGGYGAAIQCGAFRFTVPGGTTLAPGADFPYSIANQEYDGAGVTIGRVMEQDGNTVHVLLNSMSGGVK